ncbi:MAG: rod shape-determining protein MreD [Clostridiales bacterium]|jgi:rod shape-determining protein MreD|nr:rod shape-determining protein MreD [Clostridiales bacterium]
MGRLKWIRYFAYTIELLAFFVVQETPGLIPAVFGARPVLVIPAALSIALFEEELPSLFFGAFAGLLTDLGISPTLGFHALLLGVACFFLSVLAANLIHTNFLTAMASAAVVPFFLFLIQWVFFYVLTEYESPWYAFTTHYLPIYAYTAALMPVAYYFNRALALQLRDREE